MEEIIELFIQLAFETGQAYQSLYEKLGLDNVLDFKDIEYANSKGAQWTFKGDMSDLPELFKVKDKNKINELNKIVDDLQKVKDMAKNVLIK